MDTSEQSGLPRTVRARLHPYATPREVTQVSYIGPKLHMLYSSRRMGGYWQIPTPNNSQVVIPTENDNIPCTVVRTRLP